MWPLFLVLPRPRSLWDDHSSNGHTSFSGGLVLINWVPASWSQLHSGIRGFFKVVQNSPSLSDLSSKDSLLHLTSCFNVHSAIFIRPASFNSHSCRLCLRTTYCNGHISKVLQNVTKPYTEQDMVGAAPNPPPPHSLGYPRRRRSHPVCI